MALDVGERADLSRLRRTRAARAFEAMNANEIDVLVLGREGNARYATGLQRLPVAVARPFVPAAILVRSTGLAHVLSGWDFVVPPEIPPERWFSTSWDPDEVARAIGEIDGVSSARRVAVDSISPQWTERLSQVSPDSEFLDAGPVMRSVRMHKTEDEVYCIRTAVAIAESALVAASEVVRPGRRERELLGAFVARMSEFGLTVPASEGGFSAIDQNGVRGQMRRMTSDRFLRTGERVTLHGGVFVAGYEGAVGRTTVCNAGHQLSNDSFKRALAEWADLWGAILHVLRPGLTGGDIRRAYLSSGFELPQFPIATSVGLGLETPIAGSALGEKFDEEWILASGMVLQVQGLVTAPDDSYFGLETVLITEDGPEVLSTLGHGTSV